MHPTPDTDAEDLYEPTERPPLHYAEQALLGAVLLQPALLPAVEDLSPSFFDSPVHGAVFAAMREVPTPEEMTRNVRHWATRRPQRWKTGSSTAALPGRAAAKPTRSRTTSG
ncbi:DnaB-like helicase N-terminal domain-containing protein [Streptomyces venezuelae]|uniref:DnaB-like helicase N-terminal domain-containing protein n=1 Tax=Streptomyces venezuelae TaxID=54571 RepID=UPI001F1962D4|nr:DnaB-like helicase N-terminal domain-containing protein [Streptomyces venezuelae]